MKDRRSTRPEQLLGTSPWDEAAATRLKSRTEKRNRAALFWHRRRRRAPHMTKRSEQRSLDRTFVSKR